MLTIPAVEFSKTLEVHEHRSSKKEIEFQLANSPASLVIDRRVRIEISRNVDDFADQRDREIAKCGFGAAAVAPNRERGRTTFGGTWFGRCRGAANLKPTQKTVEL